MGALVLLLLLLLLLGVLLLLLGALLLFLTVLLFRGGLLLLHLSVLLLILPLLLCHHFLLVRPREDDLQDAARDADQVAGERSRGVVEAVRTAREVRAEDDDLLAALPHVNLGPIPHNVPLDEDAALTTELLQSSVDLLGCLRLHRHHRHTTSRQASCDKRVASLAGDQGLGHPGRATTVLGVGLQHILFHGKHGLSAGVLVGPGGQGRACGTCGIRFEVPFECARCARQRRRQGDGVRESADDDIPREAHVALQEPDEVPRLAPCRHGRCKELHQTILEDLRLSVHRVDPTLQVDVLVQHGGHVGR
mmetsp:Transcript_72935/g.237071  ORF Transcript_72935/g.237071 Transcript_72935/m.237071 type:complete len:307 (+) Transcript_72935:1380-2300(+)